ncbi:MAG TPA: integrase core domain-containing protein [Dermatophilaceae bacterium]
MAVSDPIPARVDAADKAGLLALVDHATGAGWSVQAACELLQISRRRVERWQHRRTELADRRPGGVAVNSLLGDEIVQILAMFDEWGERDRSHRRLAYRGSYVGRFWASPSTVRRVLFESDKHFRPLPRPAKGERRPFPDWASYKPNSIWIYDTTHFTRCGAKVLIIEDLVSRKWLSHLVSSEETTTQVQAGFTTALESEGLLDGALALAATGRVDPDADDGISPLLLAVSDNGSQMIAANTRRFMALVAIAQHFGRPSTPTDQAWIESLNGTLKAEWPHLLAITDPAVLRAELDRIQVEYNTIRLHSSIGYVTPDDEHQGRGDGIRAARRKGLHDAHQRRLAHHRQRRNNQLHNHRPDPPGVD